MSDFLDGSRTAEILLVEDNESDVFLTREGFKRAKLAVHLHHVDNGEKCMEFLRRSGPYVDAPKPDLILLDLNMPVMNGREVLAEIIQDESLCRLPVVILTTSAADKDVVDLYKLRCSSYITKPLDFVQFQHVIQEFSEYWFSVVVLPSAN